MEHLPAHLPPSCLVLEGPEAQTDAPPGGEGGLFGPQEEVFFEDP